MFSGITNYFWGSPSPKVQEAQVPVPSVEDPGEVFGDLKSMEVTSDLEEGLQTPQSPSDAEEDWVLLSGSGRIVEAPSRPDRKPSKKLRNETQVPARDTEVHELDNRLDDLPERVETSLKFKPSRQRDPSKRCTRTEVSAQHLHEPNLKPTNPVDTAAVQLEEPAVLLEEPAVQPETKTISVSVAEKRPEAPTAVVSEPVSDWKIVRRCRAANSLASPAPIKTHKNRFYSDVLPYEVELSPSPFEASKGSGKSLSPTKKARRARKVLNKPALMQNRTSKHLSENVCSINDTDVEKFAMALSLKDEPETDRRSYKSELHDLNMKYRKIDAVCTFNRGIIHWCSKGHDELVEYLRMVDNFAKKYFKNENLRLPMRHILLLSVLKGRQRLIDLKVEAPKRKRKEVDEKLKEKEREHELALALEELKPARKALQKQQHEKLSRKHLLKNNLVREVAAAGRSRLRRSDRLNPSMSSGANNNRKCQ